MSPQLVIFDCDGVLVDSEVLSNQVLVDDLSPRGFPLTLKSCMDLFVGGTIAGVKVEVERRGVPLPDTWVNDIYGVIYEKLRREVKPISGVFEVLECLDDARIPYCVASNGSLEKMQITLGKTGLLPRFKTSMFSAHVLGTAKPDPQLFLHSASTFNVAAKDCIVIEDSVTGAIAARRAGMMCLGYAPHGGNKKLLDEGAKPFTNMASLPALLGLADT